MNYVVKPGDSLWAIASAWFGEPEKWRHIAEDNRLFPSQRLTVGQTLHLRDSLVRQSPTITPPLASGVAANRQHEHAPSVIPGRAYVFVLADEINPARSKVVRKVMVNPAMAKAYAARLGQPVPLMPNPEVFGLHPTNPASNLPPGRHALGMKPSPYSSASSRMFGAPRFSGSRFWIDVDKARAAGATFHDTGEILADLDRIAAKARGGNAAVNIERIKRLVQADREVLVRGAVPANAVKGAASMALTRGLQGVQVIGFAMTAVDLSRATQKSIVRHSAKPIVAESVRQAGGWATAWAGMKLGAAGGAALGFETGPGAVVTGAIGAVVGGTAGYFGFDWIADHIDAN
ncbi:LysM domain-containing protein [Ralstonia pseudosolanacearum]|uniref:LysM peptidoglycan-binding domain-containing protein n=1 Tax=Ralstonia pseudosolanacearum TaxID=1310165 RepID=UPI002701677E|nr:LysM domain-containing protein [Ralstonia pseudosolanacearum]MDO3616619.1 LysM domain-containing protein [Ralstonia pseudosolanacearum]